MTILFHSFSSLQASLNALSLHSFQSLHLEPFLPAGSCPSFHSFPLSTGIVPDFVLLNHPNLPIMEGTKETIAYSLPVTVNCSLQIDSVVNLCSFQPEICLLSIAVDMIVPAYRPPTPSMLDSPFWGIVASDIDGLPGLSLKTNRLNYGSEIVFTLKPVPLYLPTITITPINSVKRDKDYYQYFTPFSYLVQGWLNALHPVLGAFTSTWAPVVTCCSCPAVTSFQTTMGVSLT